MYRMLADERGSTREICTLFFINITHFQFIDEKTGARSRHYNKGNALRVGDIPGLQIGHTCQVTLLPRLYNSLSQFSVGARIFMPLK